MQIKAWLSAFRLRTLPLAFSSIITGSAIAYYHLSFNLSIFILALLTTLFLQILSNLANDYGDGLSGVDNENRVGPQRAVQSGKISLNHMKKAMIVFVLLSLDTGIPLVIIGTKSIGINWLIGFLTLGITAIIAAIKYTAGKNPYGYKGWGDVFVFLFFGLVGVMGTYFLHTQNFKFDTVFPAISIGCFSAAVLNLNNLRDIENDKACGKNTLAVKLGWEKGKIYHYGLILTGIISIIYWGFINHFVSLNYLIILLPLLFFAFHLRTVFRATESKQMDAELKKVALSTFLLAILFFVSIYTRI
jgi:1,4-dihydroxy-2-naphthoate octaprenyltransferase